MCTQTQCLEGWVRGIQSWGSKMGSRDGFPEEGLWELGL